MYSERLARWDVVPRLQVCGLELLSGLNFEVNQSSKTIQLGYVDVTAKPLKNLPLVRMTSPTACQSSRSSSNWLPTTPNCVTTAGQEILTQMPNQSAFWGSIVGLTAYRHKWTLELPDLDPRTGPAMWRCASSMPSPANARWTCHRKSSQ
jgi:hypothetical protein